MFDVNLKKKCMQHVKRMTYFCLPLILIVSCRQNEDILDQGDEVVTRSYPVIITYQWQGYSGTYNSSIQPELLRAFFGRIRPPQPPSPNY